MVRVWRFVLCIAARVEQQGGRAYGLQAGRMTPGSKPPCEPGSRRDRDRSRTALPPALTRSVRRTCLAVTVAVLATLVPPPSAAQPPALFTAVKETPPPGPLDAETVRSRTVTMDLGQVRHAQAAAATASGQSPQTRDTSRRTDKSSEAPAPGTLLTLNLFADVVVTAVIERTEATFSGGYAVSGSFVEAPLGTLTLVVNGGTVVGTVRLLEETYQIRSLGKGLYAISEVEEPPFTCGVEGPHPAVDHEH